MLPHFPRPPLRSHTVGLMFNSLFLRKVSQAYVSRDENGVGDRRRGSRTDQWLFEERQEEFGACEAAILTSL
jgi:hypothetical protein